MKNIYLTIKYGKAKTTKGYILDISRSGMAIACAKRIDKKAIIEVITKGNILPPLKGRIVSTLYRQNKVYKYRLGVKFILLDKEKKNKLDKFMRKIEKRKVARLALL